MQDFGYILLIIVAVVTAILFGITKSGFRPKKIGVDKMGVDKNDATRIRFAAKNQVRDIASVDAQMERKYGELINGK